MWMADLHCDFDWVAERKGDLGDPRFVFGGRSRSLDITIEVLLYGDDQALRHVRVLMHTDNQEIADRCVNLNIHLWANGLESAVMMLTGRPFHLPMTKFGQIMALMQQGNRNTPATIIQPQNDPTPIDYKSIANAMTLANDDLKPYVFYLRRVVDMSLPLDVRWLNGYRLLEWHFVKDRAELDRSPEWRAFLGRFEANLRPIARKGQTLHGLMEEARAMAAHANMDQRGDNERAVDPLTLMQKTFPTLEDMVMTILNEHPATAALPVRFHRRGTPPPV